MDPNFLSVYSDLAAGLVVDTLYGFFSAISPLVGDAFGAVQHPECLIGTLYSSTPCTP
ncbi:hypothetical protein ACIP5Y_47180 [Nocardia sp. NPDC088792]|uniref:hypothetical protein n=1 Tax=Nocardia sp. NPDC088792 TaxID=3364332 RepID=UPI0038170D96